MDLEDIMINEISQRKKMMYDFAYMWNLKNKANENMNNIKTLLNKVVDWVKQVRRIKRFNF